MNHPAIAENGGACISVGREQKHRPVETPWATERRIHVPWLVGRTDHEDPLVGRIHTIQFNQQLCHHVSGGTAAMVHSRVTDCIELVKEEHARGIASCSIEQFVKQLFRIAEPHVQYLMQPHGDESGTKFAGHGTGKKRFAATWRTPQQQSATEIGAIGPSEFGIPQRSEE